MAKGTSGMIVKWGSVAGALGIILGGVFTLDGRYVHAEEFKKQVLQIKDSISDLHRARLEDEIFRLELVPESRRTQAEKALLQRYKNQLKEIDAKRERGDR